MIDDLKPIERSAAKLAHFDEAQVRFVGDINQAPSAGCRAFGGMDHTGCRLVVSSRY
jgi:hypothetical protein